MTWTQSDMHEELFMALLKRYKDADMSLDRIIVDPRFKALPLTEKVELLKNHGHTIHQGSKTDSQFWKDLGWGAVGSAVMLAKPIHSTLINIKAGMEYGDAVGQRTAFEKVTGHTEGMPEVEPPKMTMEGYGDLARAAGSSAIGLGLAAPKFYAALTARNHMKLVKKLLNDQPGANTTENAINVIARS